MEEVISHLMDAPDGLHSKDKQGTPVSRTHPLIVNSEGCRLATPDPATSGEQVSHSAGHKETGGQEQCRRELSLQQCLTPRLIWM